MAGKNRPGEGKAGYFRTVERDIVEIRDGSGEREQITRRYRVSEEENGILGGRGRTGVTATLLGEREMTPLKDGFGPISRKVIRHEDELRSTRVRSFGGGGRTGGRGLVSREKLGRDRAEIAGRRTTRGTRTRSRSEWRSPAGDEDDGRRFDERAGKRSRLPLE